LRSVRSPSGRGRGDELRLAALGRRPQRTGANRIDIDSRRNDLPSPRRHRLQPQTLITVSPARFSRRPALAHGAMTARMNAIALARTPCSIFTLPTSLNAAWDQWLVDSTSNAPKTPDL